MRKHFNKVAKVIFGIFAVMSLLMLLGTAGASDSGSISFNQLIVQGGISLIAFIVFFVFAAVLDFNKIIGIDHLELYKQINHRIPIDGYRIFTERQDGNRYTATFISRNNDCCVLAEIEDYTNPEAAIKIIAF